MNERITLSDGTTMGWDEFAQLSDSEQARLTRQVASGTGAGFHMPQRELLPRIRAAAERNRITEEDLLTFIKIVHDVFLPPAPTVGGSAVARSPEPVPKQQGGGAAFKAKPVRTPAGDFESIAAATRYYAVDGGRIRSWIKKGKEGFNYL
jgi:hypothetical protein